MISKGAEGKVFKVKRKSDGKIFAAKMRINPGARPDLDYEELIDVYKNFLSEVGMLSHSYHTNLSRMIQALRN